jgi:hypothetical protein
MNGVFSRFASSSAASRDRMSVEAPGAKGITSRTGLLGYAADCAVTSADIRASGTARLATIRVNPLTAISSGAEALA